ncbi:late embryogenesis abundant protein At3g53040 [Daucus carota subsp. sativus]
MAGAMSNLMTKMSFLNVSKAFPQPSFRPKVSRVCFTSASKYSQGRSGDTSEDTSDSDREFDELAQKTRENVKSGMDKTKNKAQEVKEKTKDQAYDMKEATKETANKMTEKAKEGADRAADTAKSAKDKTKDQAYNVKEKTKEAAETVSDKAAKTARDATETTKDAADTVADMTKKTVGGMWEAAKDTTQKIKETVVGKDDKDDYVEDHIPKTMDEDVVEQRRKAGEKNYLIKFLSLIKKLNKTSTKSSSPRGKKLHIPGAMSKITQSSLASLSKAISQAPSLYSRFNVSKLGFISASNYSQLQDVHGDFTDADDELGALTQKSKENVEDLMDTGHEMKEEIKNEAYDMKDTAKEAAGTAKDKAEEAAEKMKEKAGMGGADDESSEQTLGEKARQTVEEMWVVAKDTKHKIKESVVGKSGKDDHFVGDDVPERKVYEDFLESARKVGNLDHEKKE